MDRPTVLFVMAPNLDEARALGKKLVEERLVACANVVPGVHSVYIWQGNLCEDSEVLLIMKTHEKNVKRLVDRIKALHTYEVPEIIALPIIAGSEDYLAWMRETLI